MENVNKKWDFFNKLFVVICFILLFNYYYQYNFTHAKNLFFAILCLGLNLHIVFKCKHNQPLFLFSIIILYFNYSGLVSYYFSEHSPFLDFEQCNTVQIKGIMIIGLCIFTLLLDFGVDWKNTKNYEIVSDSVNGKIGYYTIVVIIISICVFYVYIRGSLTEKYAVLNLTAFEYLYLLFIIGVFFAQGDKKRQYLLVVLFIISAFVDGYYGGRVSSLEFALVIFTMFLNKWFTRKQIILLFVGGILLLSFVSLYRQTYSLSNLNFNVIFSYVTEGKFAGNSVANSLYTSFGAIKIHDFYPLDYRVKHFFDFLVETVSGYSMEGYLSLERVIRNSGIYHIGGGWGIGYAYFWFGMPGILAYSAIIVFIIRKLFVTKNPSVLKYFFYVTTIVSVPRWYLYTPDAFYKGSLIIAVLYFLIHFFINMKRFRIN